MTYSATTEDLRESWDRMTQDEDRARENIVSVDQTTKRGN